MPWEVIAVEEFAAWLLGESDGVQIETAARVAVLAEFGPQLGRPSVETIQGSAFINLKELRYKVDRRPYRVLFAFDPSRRTVLLLGGDKGKDKRWYLVNVPIAEDRLREHLASLEEAAGDGDPV